MKKLLIVFILVFVLGGCFGENYNVGHPITYIKYDSKDVTLEPTFISWNTQGDNTFLKVEDIAAFSEGLLPIEILSGQLIQLHFKDSIDEEGEYSSLKIDVKVMKNEEEIILHYTEEPTSSFLDEQYTYQMPTEPGQYLLQVDFRSSGGVAKYAGKLVGQIVC